MLGLIGLGLVGSALAERFTNAGFEVIGCDVDTGKANALRDKGLVPAQSPREVVPWGLRWILEIVSCPVYDQFGGQVKELALWSTTDRNNCQFFLTFFIACVYVITSKRSFIPGCSIVTEGGQG